jgi:RNA polymerase sigma-70 factor, ECF subfamily
MKLMNPSKWEQKAVDLKALDDAALMRLILHARQEALSELYDRYGRLVFSMAYNAVGDSGTAEEITQDVFLRIWDKAITYRPEQAKVSTWLTSITRYRSIDVLRQRGSRAEQHSVGWEELPVGEEPSSDGPENATADAMEHAHVQAAVASLPAEQRQALAMAYFQGLSHSEIAAALGEPLGTVKTRIRLAMQKLRDLLHEDFRLDR